MILLTLCKVTENPFFSRIKSAISCSSFPNLSPFILSNLLIKLVKAMFICIPASSPALG